MYMSMETWHRWQTAAKCGFNDFGTVCTKIVNPHSFAYLKKESDFKLI